jgi:hypothetical protein
LSLYKLMSKKAFEIVFEKIGPILMGPILMGPILMGPILMGPIHSMGPIH